jgi:hypothetical protein
MSNRRKLAGAIQSMERSPSGLIVPKSALPKTPYQIRILSRDPVELEDTSRFTGTWNGALNRAYILARRTSYMVNGPNREVWGTIDRMNKTSREWETVFEFKTRLREGAGPGE